MLYLFYFALLFLHAYTINFPVSEYAILCCSIMFFYIAFRKFKSDSGCNHTAFLQIICYSIPLSFRNIFGGDFSDLPLTWFYILGTIFMVNLLTVKTRKHNSFFSLLFLLIVLGMLFNLVPLLLTQSGYMNQGISQFISLTFHSLFLLMAVLRRGMISSVNIGNIQKSYVSVGLLTGLGILTQYILYQYGLEIGIVKYYNQRSSFNFLFSDASHATLYLATAAFLSIQISAGKSRASFYYIICSVVIILCSAITSARTGLVVFFILLMIYILFKQKGIKKVFFVFSGSIAFWGAAEFYASVRQGSLRDVLFDSSGRLAGYDLAITAYLQKPFIGYGFGKDYIASLSGGTVPHFSFLQYMMHGGIFYAVIIFSVIIFSLLYASKHNMPESWLLALILIGTCLVPDIFSTRSITLLVAMVFLNSTQDKPFEMNSRNSIGKLVTVSSSRISTSLVK